jgi:hypothetical protein
MADSVFHIDLRHHQDIPPSHDLSDVESQDYRGVREAIIACCKRMNSERKESASMRHIIEKAHQQASSGMITAHAYVRASGANQEY